MNYAERNTVNPQNQLSADNFVTTFVRNQSAMRVIFVGNSITRHAPKSDIGWNNDWGMAASKEENDYVHRVVEGLEKKFGPISCCIAQVAEWEQNYLQGQEFLEAHYQAAKDFQADLVIVRLGENIKKSMHHEINCKPYFEKMIGFFASNPNADVIVTDNFWRNEALDEMIYEITKEKGYMFCKLHDLQDDVRTMALGEYAHQGVAVHPGDYGMECIARRILNSITKISLQKYIAKNLPKTVRYNPSDEGKRIGLPYPYIVPCAEGKFQEMYYWDTYFTNKGLILNGEIELARNNVNNMCFLIEKYGFMLNGNRTSYMYNSQPPFLSLMIRDIYEVTGDKKWLVDVYHPLVKEYCFWTEKRQTEIGLTRYDWMVQPEEQMRSYAKQMRERMKDIKFSNDEEAAKGLASAGESGWDLTPRMGVNTYQYVPADLNSLMYALEENLFFFASELGKEDAEKWHKRAEKRAKLCRKYLKNRDQHFMDYNFLEKVQNQIFSPACFYPLFCGMATEEEARAAKEALPRIETAYGILTCEKNGEQGNYQWDYPNGWAPLQLIVVAALLRYGYREDALRIAKKYVSMVEHVFEETGHLWEKYNVVEGSVNAKNEYEMPPMLGWTFGVYAWMKELI